MPLSSFLLSHTGIKHTDINVKSNINLTMVTSRLSYGAYNRPGFPRHRINLNNPPGKKKIQAILSKVTWPKNDTGKR